MDHPRPSAGFAPLPRNQQVSASIAEQILARISSGTLTPGTRLSGEVELAREFGVSRPSVREALAALQFAGHVESRRGYGTVVLPLSPVRAGGAHRPLHSLSQAVDVLEARLVLEPQVLAIAATDPHRPALTSARRLISGMRVAVDEPELRASTDLAVHRALLATCRNGVLRDAATGLLDLALDPLLSASRTQAWSSPDLPHVWADHHDLVCRAVAEGDPDAARAAAITHLASVSDNLAAAATGDSALVARLNRMTERFGLPALKHTDE